jgi:D-alanyl-D-alanine carboxypeptidase
MPALSLRPFALAAATLALLVLTVVVFTTCGGDDSEEAPPLVNPTGSFAAAPPSATSSPSIDPTVPPTGPSTDEPGPTDSAENGNGGNGGNGAPLPSEVTLLTPVDKQHGLPSDYVPPDLVSIPASYVAPGSGGSLRAEAMDALTGMLDDAIAAGHDIRSSSAYRSHSEQLVTFQYWVDTLGYDEAVRISALPGHSEHQLGTTADLTTAEVGWDLTESFGDTAAGQWLASNAHLHGFALSYPAGAEATTGYSYEPWHFRYIGPDAASSWMSSGLTLNVYLLQ